MKKLIIVLFIILISTNIVIAQSGGLKGVDKAFVLVRYSDDIKVFLDYIPTYDYIMFKLRTQIHQIDFRDYFNYGDKDIVFVDIYFGLHKNYEAYYEEQYFGVISCTVRKEIFDKELDENIYVIVFLSQRVLISINPLPISLKNDLEEIIQILLTELSSNYYRDNSE